MRTIIAGSRNFTDYALLKQECDKYEITEVVSGTAAGADYYGEVYALEKELPCTRFPADWKKHGNLAGRIRNREMADYGERLIAFWDGKSPGTRHMIKCAKARKLEVIIIKY